MKKIIKNRWNDYLINNNNIQILNSKSLYLESRFKENQCETATY